MVSNLHRSTKQYSKLWAAFIVGCENSDTRLGIETAENGLVEQWQRKKSFLCTSLLRNTNPPKPVTWTAFLWCFMSLIGGFGDKEKTNPTSESCCLFTVCNIIRYGHYPKDGKLIKIAQSGHAIRKIRCVTTGCHQTLQPTENKKSKNPYNKMKDIEKYK